MTIIQFPSSSDFNDEGRVLLFCESVSEVLRRSTDEFADLEVSAYFSQLADGSVSVGEHQLSRDQAIELVRAIETAVLYATPTRLPDGSDHYRCADQDGIG